MMQMQKTSLVGYTSTTRAQVFIIKKAPFKGAFLLVNNLYFFLVNNDAGMNIKNKPKKTKGILSNCPVFNTPPKNAS